MQCIAAFSSTKVSAYKTDDVDMEIINLLPVSTNIAGAHWKGGMLIRIHSACS